MSSVQLSNFAGTVYLASDHAGFALKAVLLHKLCDLGINAVDMGPTSYVPGDDYPDYVEPAAEKIAHDATSRGIVIGKSGQGEAIDANRTKGIRALVYTGGNLDIVRLGRIDNDANVLSLAAGFVSEAEAWEAVQLFLSTPFSHEERHERRIKKLDE